MGASGTRVAATKMDSVTGSGTGNVYQGPTEYRGAPCTRGGGTGVERVKVRVGGTEVEIPSRVTENWGSPANWAIVDRERVRIELRRKMRGRVLGRAIVVKANNSGEGG